MRRVEIIPVREVGLARRLKPLFATEPTVQGFRYTTKLLQIILTFNTVHLVSKYICQL